MTRSLTAIETVLRDGQSLTPDMGGNASTQDLGKAVETMIKRAAI